MDQIELHKKIETILSKNPSDATQKEVFVLTSANSDARKFFFTVADERWLDWLLKNKFLDVIKERSENIESYQYRTPELDYLENVAEKVPDKVVDIMHKVSISGEHFNPEVIDRFLWISKSLPPEQLARMAQKIHDEQWPRRMAKYRRWWFDYEMILTKLVEVKDWKSFLLIAEAVLQLRDRKEQESEDKMRSDKPFYFDDVARTKVFFYLASVGDEYKEQALKLVTSILNQAVRLGSTKDEDGIFEIYDRFSFYDVDFFTLEVSEERRVSYKEDMRNLGATTKKLSEQVIGTACDNPEKVRSLYEQYIVPLPDSCSMWRFRLFVLSLCPEVFKQELKSAFNRLFQESGKYYGIISGAEYEKALQKCFSVLSNDDQREYIKQIISYFTKQDKEEDGENRGIHLRQGSKILSVIHEYLTPDEKQEAEARFSIEPDYKPQSSMVHGRSGTINPRAPITQEEFTNLEIKDIADKLSNIWTPEKIREQDKEDDFLRPLNADGLSNLLAKDIGLRFPVYILNAHLFFDRDLVNPHYTYTFLHGINDAFRNGKVQGDIEWSCVIEMFKLVQLSAKEKEFTEEERKGEKDDWWYVGWNGVHSQMADVLKELLLERDNKSPLIGFAKYRDDMLSILDYLLSYPDPDKEDNKKGRPGEPYTTAINSVRGKAFEVFTLFLYQDGKRVKDDEVKIKNDVKKVYEKFVESEYTYAVMFVIGRYFASFYYRDKEWMTDEMLPKIFSEDEKEKDLYFAAWEGYLSADVYKEVFPEFTEFYERAIKVDSSEYTQREYFKNLDEGLAIHIALAFVHFDFNFDNPLFKLFWETKNTKRHAEFISFIGRSVITRGSPEEFIEANRIKKDKLKDFWDWALEHCDDSEALANFGYWVNPDFDILELDWLSKHILETLKKTKGDIEWEHGMMNVLPRMSKECPKESLKIVKLFLLGDNERPIEHQRAPTYLDQELYEVFEILYNNEDTKKDTYDLINTLLPFGNGRFWKFKKIIKD